jgi:hypothetical protein
MTERREPTTFHFRLAPKIRTAVEIVADREAISASDVVRRAVIQRLRAEGVLPWPEEMPRPTREHSAVKATA